MKGVHRLFDLFAYRMMTGTTKWELVRLIETKLVAEPAMCEQGNHPVAH